MSVKLSRHFLHRTDGGCCLCSVSWRLRSAIVSKVLRHVPHSNRLVCLGAVSTVRFRLFTRSLIVRGARSVELGKGLPVIECLAKSGFTGTSGCSRPITTSAAVEMPVLGKVDEVVRRVVFGTSRCLRAFTSALAEFRVICEVDQVVELSFLVPFRLDRDRGIVECTRSVNVGLARYSWSHLEFNVRMLRASSNCRMAEMDSGDGWKWIQGMVERGADIQNNDLTLSYIIFFVLCTIVFLFDSLISRRKGTVSPELQC